VRGSTATERFAPAFGLSTVANWAVLVNMQLRQEIRSPSMPATGECIGQSAPIWLVAMPAQ